jgi:neutral ceramidase
MRIFQTLVSLIGLLWVLVVGSGAMHAQDFRLGAAKRDITPTEPIRLSGYASRTKPSEGVDQPIFARVLAIEDSTGAKNVLVTVELLGVTRGFTESIADRVRTQFGIERSRFMIVASHTHNGPTLHASIDGQLTLTPQEQEVIKRHTERMAGQIFEAASEALSRLEPVRLSFGHGRAGFAVNRRIFTPDGVKFGANPDGPVDHDVPVLRAETLDGQPRAIVFGYACHGTTLGGEFNLIGGDWPGYTQKALEQAYPGAMALFVTGCGADADPQPRRKAVYVAEHGLEMAGAVTAALSRGMTSVRGPVRAAFERVTLAQATLPSQEDYQKRLKDKDVFVQQHARRNLEKLARGEKLAASYDCPLQVWRFGNDLTLVALGGEVVVDYALRLKRELGSDKLWVAAYANDVFAYVPSTRILLEGGYEADYSMFFYDFPTRWATNVEETLIKAVRELTGRTEK